jgi:hypothetical protein
MKFLLTTLLLATIATASFAQSAAPSPSASASPAASPGKHHHKKAAQTAVMASPSPAASPVTATTVKTPAPAKKTPAAFVPPANAAPGGGNGLVWVNTSSKAYHKEGSKWYGKTKHGKYISEPDALKEGDHAAKD